MSGVHRNERVESEERIELSVREVAARVPLQSSCTRIVMVFPPAGRIRASWGDHQTCLRCPRPCLRQGEEYAVVRPAGIEPAISAWKADASP